MRALQKKLGIDDDMLLTAAGVSDEKEMIKRQIAKYESHVISSPPAPTPPPNTVTITPARFTQRCHWQRYPSAGQSA
jgi:hypothetical protein